MNRGRCEGKAPAFDPSTGEQIAQVSVAGPTEVNDAVGKVAELGVLDASQAGRLVPMPFTY